MIQIIASNIRGLGASHVVMSLLDAFERMNFFQGSKLYLPSEGILGGYESSHFKIIRNNSILHFRIIRLLESLVPSVYYENIQTLVLGDLPLRGIKNQVVLVHQPNLIYPSFDPYSGTSFVFRISRFIFKINARYVCKFIVQSDGMKSGIINSYAVDETKVVVSPQPAPNWLNIEKKLKQKSVIKEHKLILFYPASFYKHKMHKFLLELNQKEYIKEIERLNVEIWVTLSDDEYLNFKHLKFVRNLGKLNSFEMNKTYQKIDCLLFLSSIESYGLPLVEGMQLGLPILTVDLPYSRFLCESSATYFNPYIVSSFLHSLNAISMGSLGLQAIDYTECLKKLPIDWQKVSSIFYESLTECKSNRI